MVVVSFTSPRAPQSTRPPATAVPVLMGSINFPTPGRTTAPSIHGLHRIGPLFPAKLLSVEISPGDEVRTGQVLAVLDATELRRQCAHAATTVHAAEQAVLAATARADQAADLIASTAESQRPVARGALADALAAVALSQHELQLARRAQLTLQARLDNLQLVAPIDGVITAIHAVAGAVVTPPDPVIELVADDVAYHRANQGK